MISRMFVIVLALGMAAYRFSTGAHFEALGLLGLGTGLIFLKAGETRPHLKPYAYTSFLLTAIVIGMLLYRRAH